MQILRYPRLDTVLNVEAFIQEHDGEYTKFQLWKALPKKIMYQTFTLLLEYLFESKKVSKDSTGKIGWIFYPETVKKYLSAKHLERKVNT